MLVLDDLVVAVAGTFGSLVIFREGFCQVAGLTCWQITAANRRYYYAADHGIGIGDGLRRVCQICTISYVQLGSNKLVRQYNEAIALRGLIKNL